ncbi:hypothetical protein ONS95_004003 [Cadophora gregata]|nr:uncharacterized protein ONS95_004003 [Cadophora gregata]KAK0107307.1 hypothetical protein ONS95_004003 [Cadophora gregata]KAK0116990.1 hypothetical protein ONS96_012831 [Cadophora gregata f. sp. sojae]
MARGSHQSLLNCRSPTFPYGQLFTKTKLSCDLPGSGETSWFPCRQFDFCFTGDHAQFGKVLAPAFPEKAIALYEPIVSIYVDSLVSKFEQEVENGSVARVVDIVPWVNCTTSDIISNLGWGLSIRCLEQQNYHPWVTVVLHFEAMIVTAARSCYPTPKKLVSHITPKSALAGPNLVLSPLEANVKSRLHRKTN